MRPRLPATRAPLHHCATPITHSSLAVVAVLSVLAGWWLGLGQLGAWVRGVLLAPGSAPVSHIEVWAGTLLLDGLWIVGLPIFGTTLAYVVVMGSCSRVPGRLAPSQTQGGSGDMPVQPGIVIERIYLDAQGARQLGLDGQVILERVSTPHTGHRHGLSQ